MTVSPLQMAVSPTSFEHFPTLLHNLNNCIIIIILIIINIIIIMIIIAHYQAIYDYHTGECMATMAGHSELVTGLAFSNDCRHLISVSGMMMLMMMIMMMIMIMMVMIMMVMIMMMINAMLMLPWWLLSFIMVRLPF